MHFFAGQNYPCLLAFSTFWLVERWLTLWWWRWNRIRFYSSVTLTPATLCWRQRHIVNPPLYRSKNSYYVYYTTWSWNLNASKVVFYVQRVVQIEQFVRVLFKVGPGILYYGMPRLYAITLGVAQRRSAGLCEIAIDSACSAVIDRQCMQCSHR